MDLSYDMTSPVRSFLEKSKRQVEKYIRDKFSLSSSDVLGEAKLVDSENDLPADPDHILIKHDKKTGRVQGTVQDPNGNVYTFVKPRQDVEEMSSKGKEADEKNDNSKVISSLEDFLNPDNMAIQKLIEHHVLKNPTVLSELLTAKFSDLVTVFHGLMKSKVSTVEGAYLKLLKIGKCPMICHDGFTKKKSLIWISYFSVEDEGSNGIAQRALQQRELIEAVSNGEKVEYKMKEDHLDDDLDSPSLRLKGVNSVLSDDEINAIIDKYLASIGKNVKDPEYLETRKRKVKAAAIMDLLNDSELPTPPQKAKSEKANNGIEAEKNEDVESVEKDEL